MPKRKSAPGGADEGMVVLHRSTFIEWQPSPIVALSSSHDGSLCAAVRENGDVELYESSTLHQLQVFRIAYYMLQHNTMYACKRISPAIVDRFPQHFQNYFSPVFANFLPLVSSSFCSEFLAIVTPLLLL